ncbi:phosphoserine phosphatase SerB [Pseudoalteromonas maricaloris]|uniref:phosphoserine phosphatase SerB n=1 Tax=Pseudoalteromonas maricaloris TaxID=184924 RepID=UPI0021AD5576|nr:phosphoserine phosphatase SerB [Pseudoalteromonas flavipulchra]USE68260.1 phosphoserine phosphatase SerB [Pseudoalteromonas flavipulchra]
MSSIIQFANRELNTPIQEHMALAHWYSCQGNTSLTQVNQLPETTTQSICFFGQNIQLQHLLEVEKFLRTFAIEQTYFTAYQPHEQLPVALGIRFNASHLPSKAEVRGFAKSINAQGAVITQAPTLEEPGLLVMDMDSTAIQIECIDEIARLAGRYDEVASITAQAMAGALSFSESLHRRVASLSGVPLSQIQSLKENLPLMPGIELLCQALKQHHWHLAIASGGFTWFAESLIEPLQLDAVFANTLEVENAQLTGKVLGDIVDADKKAEVLGQLATQYAIPMTQTVAIGDGANDLVMMANAQLGVAIHGKPKVVESADAAICEGSLLQLLYLLGVPK